MEPAKLFCDNLGFCISHPKEKLTLLCTKKSCQLPRLICYKCAHIKTHPECEKDLIILEDLEASEYTESLRNWLKEDDFRTFLNVFIKEAKSQNLDAQFQELTECIEENCQILIKSIINKIDSFKNELIVEMRKFFFDTDFEEHLSLEKLRSILTEKAKDNKKDINASLSNFFDYDCQSFLHKKNGQTSVPEIKAQIGKNFDELDRSFEKICEIKDFLNFFMKKSYEIARFANFNQPWTYTNNQIDCLTFTVNQDIVLTGVSIFSVSNNEKSSGLFKVLEGNEADWGKILFQKNFEVDNPQKELFVLIPIEYSVEIKKNTIYTLFLSIDKGQSHYGDGAADVIRQHLNDFMEIQFTFSKTHFKNLQTNGTWEESGQFQKIHFYLI